MAVSILTNTVIAGLGRISTIAIGIVVAAVLTRFLGVNNFGIYTFILSFGTILQIGADFGLYLTLSREIAEKKTNPQQFFSYIMTLRGILLVVVFVGGVITLPLFAPEGNNLVNPFIILFLGLILQSLSQLFMAVYQAYGTVWKATIGDIAGRLVQIVGLLGIFRNPELFHSTSPVIASVAIFTIGCAVAAIVHLWFIPHIKPWKISISTSTWRHILRTSWPLGVILIANAIYFRIDIVMLSYFHPGPEVGWYGLAYRIVESLLFFPAMFGGLLLPHITAGIVSNQNQKTQKFIVQGLLFIITAGIGTAGILVLYAKDIIEFLSGTTFIPAVPLLQILSLALLFMFMGNFFGFILIALKKQKQLLTLSLTLMVANILGNLLFIPRYGALAAATTTVLTECIAMSVAISIVYTAMPFQFEYGRVGKILLISAGVAVIGLYLPQEWHIVVRTLVVEMIFFTALFGFQIIQKKDISILLDKHSV